MAKWLEEPKDMRDGKRESRILKSHTDISVLCRQRRDASGIIFHEILAGIPLFIRPFSFLREFWRIRSFCSSRFSLYSTACVRSAVALMAAAAAVVARVVYVISITAFCFDINLLMIDMMNDFAVKRSVNIPTLTTQSRAITVKTLLRRSLSLSLRSFWSMDVCLYPARSCRILGSTEWHIHELWNGGGTYRRILESILHTYMSQLSKF